MKEKVAIFGRYKSLVGIVTEPSISVDNNLPAIIILNAGLLHRVGPNRLHVRIAREMSKTGFCVFRFDFSGIGDSKIRNDSLPTNESMVCEVQEAMSHLNSTRGINAYILIGICSGADMAFKTAQNDPRVVGIIGINGYYLLENNENEAWKQYAGQRIQSRYYRSRLLNPTSWKRVLTGKSNLRAVMKFLTKKIKGSFTQKIVETVKEDISKQWIDLADCGTDVLLVYSEGSSALDTFCLTTRSDIFNSDLSGMLNFRTIEKCDHVFTLLWSQQVLMELVHSWLVNTNRNWACILCNP